jgi:uncharacterized protein (TIGR00661 family)
MPLKILYGVQGTGNGHLSRARAMAESFAERGVSVDWLFTGRPRERFFDMAVFGNYHWRRGLTFVSDRGRVNYRRTLLGNHYVRFLRDVWSLDLAGYDLVLTDFEPVSAWAGRLRGKTVISLGHQPAFDFRIPVPSRDLQSTLVMRLFAPGTIRVGMHWDPFGAPLLPPLVDLKGGAPVSKPHKVLVYLPFEDQDAVQEMLRPIEDFEFYLYAPGNSWQDEGTLHLRPLSRAGFQGDLRDCGAVLCNAGFELASECLVLGKRLLVKAQERQMEQAANALALTQLGYGSALSRLDPGAIEEWLRRRDHATCLKLPPVGAALVDWLLAGDYSAASRWALSDRLWRGVSVNGRPIPGVSPLLDYPAAVGG